MITVLIISRTLCVQSAPGAGDAPVARGGVDARAARWRGGTRLTDFQHDLLFLLHDLGRLLRVNADKRARAEGMTRAQWGILLWLERQPGMSQKELAELLEVEPITVARLIDRLERRGMVERRPDPKDRRIWRLHLSAAAYPMLGEIDRQRALLRELATEGLDEATLETMTEALVTMKTTLTHDQHARRFAPTDEARQVA